MTKDIELFGTVNQDELRHVALNFHKDAFSLVAPPVDLHWPEPTTPFLLRRVPTLLVYVLLFVAYGLLLATMAAFVQ